MSVFIDVILWNWNPENFANSLVTGGQVSRVNPESTGLNPAWRKSLVYAAIGTGWRDGANSTEIAAVRQLLVQDMKLLESIAPESGAYLNEVKKSLTPMHSDPTNFFYYFRLRDMNSTGRNPSLAHTMTNSVRSSGSTTQNHTFSFITVLDQMSGM